MIAVCAVRTGCGKSQTTRKVAQVLKDMGKQVVAIRHPMPYGDLSAQKVQRFASVDDLKKHDCTIEEMEEYEPHIASGTIIYAGVDYEAILREAEKEADVILWDGGNNDIPFYKPDLWITVADPHRPGHEKSYYPGRVNAERAHVVLFNKMETADAENVKVVERNIKELNPTPPWSTRTARCPWATERDRGQARARGRGRPHAHARRHEVRRRRDRGPEVRGGRDRRPSTLRGRRDRPDLRELPGDRPAPAGHGLR